jgi:hypothetical protein
MRYLGPTKAPVAQVRRAPARPGRDTLDAASGTRYLWSPEAALCPHSELQECWRDFMENLAENAYFRAFRLEYRPSRSLPTFQQIEQVLSIFLLELGNFP